jgi:hypothetical protein
MFFADQIPQCAEEGAGLGWFECHCWYCGGFVGVEMWFVDQRDPRMEMSLFGGVEIVVVGDGRGKGYTRMKMCYTYRMVDVYIQYCGW